VGDTGCVLIENFVLSLDFSELLNVWDVSYSEHVALLVVKEEFLERKLQSFEADLALYYLLSLGFKFHYYLVALNRASLHNSLERQFLGLYANRRWNRSLILATNNLGRAQGGSLVYENIFFKALTLQNTLRWAIAWNPGY
jgi:hypothetical protein